jgi:hypothetical protein
VAGYSRAVYRLLASIFAVVASFAALAVPVSHSDANVRLPAVSGGAAILLLAPGQYARHLFVVGTIKRPSSERFRVVTLDGLDGGAVAKASCVYHSISSYRVNAVDASFVAQAACRGVRGGKEYTFQRKNRFTIANSSLGATPQLVDNKPTHPLLIDHGSLLSPGSFKLDEGGGVPRPPEARKSPYVVGGAWRYGPRAGSVYYVAVNIQGSTRSWVPEIASWQRPYWDPYVEVIEDSSTGFTRCVYWSVYDLAVSGDARQGYRTTFQARGECTPYVLREDRPHAEPTPWFPRDRFTIVDHPGTIGDRDTLQLVRLDPCEGAPVCHPNSFGFDLPTHVVEAGNFTAGPP